MAFALTVLVWPPFYSAATAPRWALLAIVVPALLMIRPREHRWGAVAVLAIAAVSLLWTSNVFNGLDILFKFSLLAGVFALVRTEDSPKVLAGMGWGLAFNALVLGFQMFGSGSTFINPNFLAEAAAPVLVGLLCLRQYLLACAPAACLALTGARGPLLAVSAAAFAWLWGRSRAAAVLLLLAIAAAVLAMLATGYRLESVAIRIAVWRDALGALTFFGHGLGSVYTDFPGTNHLHNDALELIYELGIGSIAFFAVIVIAFQAKMHTERLVLLTILVEGCFGFPLHLPTTGFLLAVMAGVLCHARDALRDHVDIRRDPVRTGSAAFGAVRRRAF